MNKNTACFVKEHHLWWFCSPVRDEKLLLNATDLTNKMTVYCRRTMGLWCPFNVLQEYAPLPNVWERCSGVPPPPGVAHWARPRTKAQMTSPTNHLCCDVLPVSVSRVWWSTAVMTKSTRSIAAALATHFPKTCCRFSFPVSLFDTMCAELTK